MKALKLTGHLLYNMAYTYIFQLKTTIVASIMFHPRGIVENQDQTRQNILQVTDRHLENF